MILSGVFLCVRGWSALSTFVLTATLGFGALRGCVYDAVSRTRDTRVTRNEPLAGRAVSHTAASYTPVSSTPSPVDSSEAEVGATATANKPTVSLPSLATFDHVALRKLETMGFGFAAMALGIAQRESGISDNATLSADPGYASIVRTLSTDLDALIGRDKRAGVGMRFAHRAFDKAWLTSSKFRFELVGVVHRVDRRVFANGTCGELRFIYRLAYSAQNNGKPVASRVPMTVNVVRFIDDPACARWLAAMQRVDENNQRDPASEWTAFGAPLSPEVFALTKAKSVEVNLQSVRWPSTVRPNMAGHAEYLMRVFRRSAAFGPFEPAVLENTLDVDRLNQDRGLRQKLSEWLQSPEQNTAIAQGTVRVPDEFLAMRVVSVAPHGLARKANRPFSALLLDSWGDNPETVAVLRRLDGLSCPGCHQSRSVAGFHVLGSEGDEKHSDKLASPHSAHFADDLARRRTYVQELARGLPTNEFRAPAERALGLGDWGSRCGLGVSAAAPFANWTCAPGLVCSALDDRLIGECLPQTPQVGDACEPGVTTWDAPGRDYTRLEPARSCGEGRVCERNAVGFPGGMCSSGCERAEGEHAVCGGIAVLDSFNACIARGEAFETCLTTTTRPGTLRRCSHENPCRDDYVCAATPSGDGACLPPYFLFQLRVDGHVIN